jgi:ribonuclease R
LSFALPGDFAEDEIVSVRLVTEAGQTTGTLVQRHGTLADAITVAKVVLDRHQLPLTHTEALDTEAARCAGRAHHNRNPLRRDLTEQLVITIDAPHSRDLDDAVAASVDPDGHVRVWVHISDVAEHVTAGSPIDLAAHDMPTSVYLPDYVRPMLPEQLAHDVLSLVPGVVRDTLTAEMRISPTGVISAVDVYESRISSRTRLSYSTVGKILDGQRGRRLEGLDGEDLSEEVVDLVGWLWAAASRLGQNRSARGGVDAFRVDSQPGQDSREDNAHLLIERLMVAANESVAAWLTERGVPTLYRVHDPIDNESAEELEKIADAFGVKAHLGRPVSPQAFAAFASSLDRSRSAGLWDAILGLMGRARYSVEATGHFGLGASQYLHFTSPIRRYADLRVHRLVKAYLHGTRDLTGVREELISVSEFINPILRRADMAMRDGDRSAALAKVKLTSKSTTGVVTSVSARGLSVVTPLAPVPVFIAARAVGKGRRIDPARRVLIDSDNRALGVGARIDLRITDIDVLAGRMEGTLARSGEPDTEPRTGRGTRGAKTDSKAKRPRPAKTTAGDPKASNSKTLESKTTDSTNKKKSRAAKSTPATAKKDGARTHTARTDNRPAVKRPVTRNEDQSPARPRNVEHSTPKVKPANQRVTKRSETDQAAVTQSAGVGNGSSPKGTRNVSKVNRVVARKSTSPATGAATAEASNEAGAGKPRNRQRRRRRGPALIAVSQ